MTKVDTSLLDYDDTKVCEHIQESLNLFLQNLAKAKNRGLVTSLEVILGSNKSVYVWFPDDAAPPVLSCKFYSPITIIYEDNDKDANQA